MELKKKLTIDEKKYLIGVLNYWKTNCSHEDEETCGLHNVEEIGIVNNILKKLGN